MEFSCCISPSWHKGAPRCHEWSSVSLKVWSTDACSRVHHDVILPVPAGQITLPSQANISVCVTTKCLFPLALCHHQLQVEVEVWSAQRRKTITSAHPHHHHRYLLFLADELHLLYCSLSSFYVLEPENLLKHKINISQGVWLTHTLRQLDLINPLLDSLALFSKTKLVQWR